MRIAFVGKGGSGKSTLASSFALFLNEQKKKVIVIDGDINQQLGQALGFSKAEINVLPTLGNNQNSLKEICRGTNPRITSVEAMIKTTPPGSGSRLVPFIKARELFKNFILSRDNISFMESGEFTFDDIGVRCYHSKTGSIELLLNHVIDTSDEYIVVDMTAGADVFASGLFTKFDLTVIVVEPTEQSMAVYDQYKKYADTYNVSLVVVGNKIEDKHDIEFIRSRAKDTILYFPHSQFLKAKTQNRIEKDMALEEENKNTLSSLQNLLDNQVKNWGVFYRQTVEFHIKNAESWANAIIGTDLREQIDPHFSLTEAINRL